MPTWGNGRRCYSKTKATSKGWEIRHSMLCLGEEQVTYMEEERHDSREATRGEVHSEAEADWGCSHAIWISSWNYEEH